MSQCDGLSQIYVSLELLHVNPFNLANFSSKVSRFYLIMTCGEDLVLPLIFITLLHIIFYLIPLKLSPISM